MNKELKQKWINALRSDKYHQCIEKLKNQTGFSVLGVLCDVSGLGKWNNDNSYLGSFVTLPSKIRNRENLSFDPMISVKLLTLAEHMKLIQMRNISPEEISIPISVLNDCYFSFKRLADIIEESNL